MSDIKHVVDNRKDDTLKQWQYKTICGMIINKPVWVFLDIDHVYFSVSNKGNIQPCKKCLKKIVSTFNKELDGTIYE